jgi:small subunit ribosomal protein S7
MPRRAAAQVRRIEPDAIHRSRIVQQVINKVMLDGKKSTAESIVYDALAILGERSGKEPVESLEQSIKALTPVLEVRSRRVGGATYQVPVEVPAPRARTLAVRWLVEFARQRREKTMAQRLANELLDAQQQQGGAYKRKDDIYRMAQANKAFAHYRWYLSAPRFAAACEQGSQGGVSRPARSVAAAGEAGSISKCPDLSRHQRA